MPRSTLNSPRRTPRFAPVAKPTFFLPQRCPAPSNQQVHARPAHHTYYLSCDVRGLSIYLPHAVKQFYSGFRAVLVAPAGLVFEPPSVVLLGLQDGDTFEHGKAWAQLNPLDEIHIAAAQNRTPITLKAQEKAQTRFQNAVATLEGVEQAKKDAEAALEEATAALIELQGVESIVIDGTYYDPTYSREKVYLKRRDARFNPQNETAPVKKKRGKRGRRAA